jgi:hypothetical protein
MGGGTMVYVLGRKPRRFRRLPLVAIFDPASKEAVGSVADQDAYFGRWLRARQR